ncbi:hypothetical protein CEUSTIGMA_g13219.t1 [Chlamydomonas eustigma]|uniref:Uncharacterized protein n=1 Tax=Chlamydomonas eustigma TaxID=1157962 RepID=A0A250XRX3_9CHLO|nr:hypothetical protein CEUSTIGMA_g13219.t1 [Chlamydomonas eustigma]|eukprot:GAX85804.1 hypothetical protein CEUSTIGMA_g13219.t1 [Chlamydomonas eustigma]
MIALTPECGLVFILKLAIAMSPAWSRRVLITGATKGGIGFEAARQLLSQGHHVVLTLRDRAKAKEAVETLVQELVVNSGQSEVQARERVQWVKLDLLSFASVREAGAEIRQKFTSLDALLLNAGTVPSKPQPQFSEDGWETTYQANHLSHFLLTHLLLPTLMASTAPGGARVVVVSSELHARGLGKIPASPSYLHSFSLKSESATHRTESATSRQDQKEGAVGQEPFFTPLQIYALSKLYNLWFAFKFSSMCAEAGLPITVDTVTPGFVPASNLGRSGLSWWVRIAWSLIMPRLPFAVTLQVGAKRLADVVAGRQALEEQQQQQQPAPGTSNLQKAATLHTNPFDKGLKDQSLGSDINEANGPSSDELVHPVIGTNHNAATSSRGDGEECILLPRFGSGRYFSKGKPCPSSPDSCDLQRQEELWMLSMKATGLAGDASAYLPSSARLPALVE